MAMEAQQTAPAAPARRRPFFAHSPCDAVLPPITLAQLALILWGIANFSRLSVLALVAYAAAHVIVSVTNYNVAAHNFVHNPFFTRRWLNAVYAALNSIAMMTSCTLARIDHVEHHRFGNDAKDPITGTTRDSMSTYQCGKDGEHEPLWRYAFRSPLRDWLGIADSWRTAKRSRAGRQIAVEALVLVLFWIAMAGASWKFALFYLGVVYLSLAGTYAQNYFEHYGAMPGSRKTDAVSCYAPVYNFLWCNNGYHQEHHFRPGLHWTKLRALRPAMPPEDRRRVVPWAHFTNYPWFGKGVASRRDLDPEPRTP